MALRHCRIGRLLPYPRPEEMLHFVQAQSHLLGVLNRQQGQLFQRGHPAIPEVQIAVGAVEQRRRPARCKDPADAASETFRHSEAIVGAVTVGAGDGAVGGQQSVREQAPTQGNFRRCQGIVRRYGNWLETDGWPQRPTGLQPGPRNAEQKQDKQDSEQHFSSALRWTVTLEPTS